MAVLMTGRQELRRGYSREYPYQHPLEGNVLSDFTFCQWDLQHYGAVSVGVAFSQKEAEEERRGEHPARGAGGGPFPGERAARQAPGRGDGLCSVPVAPCPRPRAAGGLGCAIRCGVPRGVPSPGTVPPSAVPTAPERRSRDTRRRGEVCSRASRAGHRAPARRGGTGPPQRAALSGAGRRHGAGGTGSAPCSPPAALAAPSPGPAMAAMPRAGSVPFFPADVSREPGRSGAAPGRSAAAVRGAAAAAGREMGLAARTAPQRCGPGLPAGCGCAPCGGSVVPCRGASVRQWCERAGICARYCKRAYACVHGRVQACGFLYSVAMRPWGFGRRQIDVRECRRLAFLSPAPGKQRGMPSRVGPRGALSLPSLRCLGPAVLTGRGGQGTGARRLAAPIRTQQPPSPGAEAFCVPQKPDAAGR